MTGPGGTPAASGPAPDPATARRVRRLLRWYPVSWRERYGEEFAELLLADLAERPGAWCRTANVARCGLTARLAGDIDAAGLAVLAVALVTGGQATSRAKPVPAAGHR